MNERLVFILVVAVVALAVLGLGLRSRPRETVIHRLPPPDRLPRRDGRFRRGLSRPSDETAAELRGSDRDPPLREIEWPNEPETLEAPFGLESPVDDDPTAADSGDGEPTASDATRSPRGEALRTLKIGAAWFVGGLLATLASQGSARPGGSYTVMWGATAYGAWQVVAGAIALARAEGRGRPEPDPD